MDVADKGQNEFSAGRVDDQKYVCSSSGHKYFLSVFLLIEAAVVFAERLHMKF